MEAPCDDDVHAWIVSSFRRMPKREAFLQDQDLVRVLYPEDGAPARRTFWTRRPTTSPRTWRRSATGVVCAVLEARGVR